MIYLQAIVLAWAFLMSCAAFVNHMYYTSKKDKECNQNEFIIPSILWGVFYLLCNI